MSTNWSYTEPSAHFIRGKWILKAADTAKYNARLKEIDLPDDYAVYGYEPSKGGIPAAYWVCKQGVGQCPECHKPYLEDAIASVSESKLTHYCRVEIPHEGRKPTYEIHPATLYLRRIRWLCYNCYSEQKTYNARMQDDSKLVDKEDKKLTLQVKEHLGQQAMHMEIKYSDVLQFYNYLLDKQGLQTNTLESVHTLLHPTFQLAVRDEIVRKNPTDGVMAEIKKSSEQTTGVRHALTIPQQRAFMEHIANHPVYCHWWPLFAVLLGTGCRIGEALGLRWDDLDYDHRTISINHSLVYYPVGESRNSVLHISTPKTDAGIRTIPMLDTVKDAFEMLHEEQKESGWSNVEIDGMSGFIFCNRFGNVPNPQSVNRAIKRIIADYNAGEEVGAKKQHREAILLPDFSAHHLRHTFCTRLCEKETNLKVIQSVMGHKDIQTTMDIYAEATEEKKQESFERLAATLDIF